MARIRSIYPEACDSKKLGAVSASAERLYWRLQTHCDDHGRCEDDARLIHARCLPLVDEMTPQAVEELLWELHEARLVHRYVGEPDESLIQVARWADFQHPQKPKASKYRPFEPITRRIRYQSSTDHVSVASGEGEDQGGDQGDGEDAASVPRNPGKAASNVTATSRSERVAAAIEIHIRRVLAKLPPPTNPDLPTEARLRGLRSAAVKDHTPALNEAAFRNLAWTPEQLADTLRPVSEQTVARGSSEVVRRVVKDRDCPTCGGLRCLGTGQYQLDPEDRDSPLATCANEPYEPTAAPERWLTIDQPDIASMRAAIGRPADVAYPEPAAVAAQREAGH